MSQQTSKFQKIASFFKGLNAKHLNLLFLLFIVASLLVFQNCKFDKDTQNNEPLGTNPSPTGSNRIGSIAQIDENGNAIENQTLPVDSDVTFKLFNVDPSSDSYKWTITRGFDPIVTGASTTTDTYKTQFSNLGAHDVSANSYKGTDPKTGASKRFVVGESCSLEDILEIELSSDSASSFKVGESGSATFALKDSTNFSSITWKAKLPSGTEVNATNENILTVDLSSESAGTLVVEVSAVSSDTSKAGCLTYRKRRIPVTSNLTPYLNPMSFSDGSNEVKVTLENNDIYKYERPQTTRYLQMQVLNADSCQYQINRGSEADFSCSGELIEIPASTGTDCVQGIITVSVSNSQGGRLSQSYYHYCPENGGYCYFGPTDVRPGHHICSLVLGSQKVEESNAKGIGLEVDPSVTTTTSTTTTLSCPSGQHTSSSACDSSKPSNSTCSAQGNGCYGWSCNSGYRKEGSSCVVCATSSSCNSSKPANSTCSADGNGCYFWSCNSGYTRNGNSCVSSTSKVNGRCNNSRRNGCSSGTANDQAIADTTTHYRWHCVGSGGGTTATNCQKSKVPRVNGVCNNSQINGCISGTPNDAAIVDTPAYHKWHCVGSGGGSTATNCQKAKPQVTCGRCGTYQGESNASCSAGTFHPHPPDTNKQYLWTCRNNPFPHANSCGGKQEASCNQDKPVNGVCNNSQINGCISGTPNDAAIVDTPAYHKWHCVGSGGGSTATNCQKAKRVNGVCNNSKRNGCTSGTASDSAIADTATHYRWHCVGSGGGSTATNCQKTKPVQVTCGRCGTYQGESNASCSAGTFHSHPPDTKAQYKWTCRNNPFPHASSCGGKQEASCNQAKPRCTCNTSQNNGCGNGCSATQTPADTASHYRWTCTRSGYQSSGTCSKAKSQCTCNTSQNNGCGNGCSATQRPPDTSNEYKWTCTRSGYRDSGTCSKAKPQCACNNSQNNGCGNGCSATQNPADTTSHYRWTCTRSGYQSSGTCSKEKPPAPPPSTTTTTSSSCPSGQYDTEAQCERGMPNGYVCVQQSNSCWKRENFDACGKGCIGNFCVGGPGNKCTNRHNCHVKAVDGKCHPSCGYAAGLRHRRYRGCGKESCKIEKQNRKDDPHAYVNGPCSDLDKSDSEWASSDFDDFRDIGKVAHPDGGEARLAWEVKTWGGHCCIRDRKSTATTTTTTTTRGSTTTTTTVVCGRCGNSNETCKAGEPHSHPPDTDTKWIWTCRNIPHTKGQCSKREKRCTKNK